MRLTWPSTDRPLGMRPGAHSSSGTRTFVSYSP